MSNTENSYSENDYRVARLLTVWDNSALCDCDAIDKDEIDAAIDGGEAWYRHGFDDRRPTYQDKECGIDRLKMFPKEENSE